ncbi:MAG: sulfurtransferase TusA family protein [Proteobacteria bacterium]|nr:MAG: sulfurtransferase TusA family protein [Pseudomonadota bacterium]
MAAVTIEVDARNLMCPMPVIRCQNAVENQQAGARVIVRCTDPGALNDIPAWSRINGHRVVESREEGGEIVIVVEVGAPA